MSAVHTNTASKIDATTPLFHVTFFTNQSAQELWSKDMTLEALRDLILNKTANEKSELPWLKLATFGKKRTDKNCLRHDANVLAISGVELDYDAGVMPFDEAFAIAKGARLHALLYTTATYKDAEPKWRILLPTTCALEPEQRVKLVERVHGLYGGVFAGESFTLSQAYLFGSVNSNSAHRAEIVEGDFIDLRADLDATALGKSGKPKTNGNGGWGADWCSDDVEDDELIEKVRSAAEYHNSLVALAARQVGRGQDAADVIYSLQDLMNQSTGPRDKRWQDRFDDIPRTVGSAVRKYSEPSQTADELQAEAHGTSDQIKTEAVAADADQKEASPGATPTEPMPAVKTQPPQAPKPNIHATPFDWIVPEKIPLRRWVYRPHYIRKFASLTVSTGGIGKSSQLIVEALAMTSGKPLLVTQPEKKLRVWYWNGEDPMDELQRRFAAAVKHYGLKPDDIGDRLFVDSGRIMQIVIAVELKRVAQIAMPVIKEVIATLRENEIDILMIDPFVSCHRVNENDNAAIERVAKSWSYIAEETNCSVMLAHHSRKTGGGEGVTVDDGRGASALLAAVRSARTLNNMSVREAENAEINERERRSYFRADIGKANLTPPAEAAEWFKLVSINLGNGECDAFLCGDNVGVVTAWKYPKATAPTITASDIRRAQNAIKAGGRWREDQRSEKEPWVGIPIAQALGLDLDRKKDKRAVVDLVRTWLAVGWLKKVGGQDAGRKPRDYIEAGKAPADEVPKPDKADSDIPF